MPASQLTTHERYQITYLHMNGYSNAAIGQRLGRHRATIGRELSRNTDPMGGYHYLSAQARADTRRRVASRRYKLDTPGSIAGMAVRAGLKQRWSPEQIAGRLRRDHPDDSTAWVSHETIYQWVYRQSLHGKTLYQRLRRSRRHRRKRIPGDRKGKRGVIPGRVGIEQRPEIVDERGRFGDWESDTVEGAKGRGLVATHVERKSRYTLLGKLNDKKAVTISRSTTAAMKGLPKKLRRTATFDNGKEFADFKTIEYELGLTIYFANPHSPWERGVNENTNGLLRDWLPKGSDFSKVTNARLAQIQKMLNNRPRKCLNYRTPIEVLNDLPGVALRN
ncbi:MAG: IS30 family transposase [Planctomycetota bacterium]